MKKNGLKRTCTKVEFRPNKQVHHFLKKDEEVNELAYKLKSYKFPCF